MPLTIRVTAWRATSGQSNALYGRVGFESRLRTCLVRRSNSSNFIGRSPRIYAPHVRVIDSRL